MDQIQLLIGDLKDMVVQHQPPMDRYEDWLKTAGLDSKSHQIRGMDFCLSREATAKPYGVKGGIIADEMGLGKTILMLGSMMVNKHEESKDANNLIVLPPALLDQWTKLIKKFTGIIPLVYHGYGVKNISDDQIRRAQIVITTYGMISERRLGSGRRLWKFEWNRLIMDEAHHIRNMKTGTFKGALKLRADKKWLVTGTPIQNAFSDFYALCGVLGLKAAFYADPNNIKKIVNHHVLRRTKKQVGIQLPPLDDEYIVVPWLSKEEEKLAKHIHAQASFSRVKLDNVNQLIQNLTQHPLPMLIRARQVCVFPHLVSKAVKKMKRDPELSAIRDISQVKTASKATAVVNHVMNRINNNRRKIIFCHYRGEIDLISALLRQKGVNVGTMDGRTGKRDRQKILEISDDHCVPDVIVVQIQTACEGLNLQHFQEIYFTSPHWNPAIEDQAVARAHRIGQNERVNVFRFVMQDFANCTCGKPECKTEASITIDTYCKMIQQKKRELSEIIEKKENTLSIDSVKKLNTLEDRARNQDKRIEALMKKFGVSNKKPSQKSMKKQKNQKKQKKQKKIRIKPIKRTRVLKTTE
jgi:SNF2 family DNA or RNA helicase